MGNPTTTNGTPARDTVPDADASGAQTRPPADALAPALGWFSIALGVPQVLAPGGVNRLAGLEDSPANRTIMRAIGLRELAAGFGILRSDDPGGWLRARVAGDALDLALLGTALRTGDEPEVAEGPPGDGPDDRPHGRVDRKRLRRAAAAVAGVTALDLIASARSGRGTPTAVSARASITIRRTPEDVWAHWRDVSTLPSFMWHLESVEVRDHSRSHWVAKGPLGTRIEWDAEITEEVPGRRLAWRSAEGSEIPNRGWVELTPAPAGQGTEVRVELVYEPPAGQFGAAVARMLGEEPHRQVRDDLRRFKQVMETGEVVRSDGNPAGTAHRRQFPQHPAKPLTASEAEEVRA